MKIAVKAILPNPDQPRQNFSQQELKELAQSIKRHGLINAVAVEDAGAGRYILVDGERRLRAHYLLGREEIEATVLPPSNGKTGERLLRAFVANLQRADLLPVEEAGVYKKLLDAGMSYNNIAYECGVSLPVVMGRLKLLELEEEVQDLVDAGKLPVDQRSTLALLSIGDALDQVKMARRLARPGIRILTIERACRTYGEILETKRVEKGTPALELARKGRRRSKDLPPWSSLQLLGRLPPWSEIRLVANETCRACSLYDLASEQTCRDCPAVELLRRLLETADERK